MVYGELGRFPVAILVKVRMISCWGKLLSCNLRLSSIMYSLVYNLSTTNESLKFDLINNVKNILQDTGMSYVWLSLSVSSVQWLKNNVKLVLTDQFKQTWRIAAESSSKGEYYVIYKDILKLEPYLLELHYKFRIWITRLRTSNHRLPIENGRRQNIDKEKKIYPV